MKLTPKPVPGHQRGAGSAWTSLVSPEMLSILRAHPGQTFQVLNDDGTPAVLSSRHVAAIMQSCPRPYRVISRATDRKSQRLVWVANDPGHWQRRDDKRKDQDKQAKKQGKP